MKSSIHSPSEIQEPSETYSPSTALNIHRWFRTLRQEARTRILLIYAASLLLVVAIAIPIFRHFLFSAVDARVEEDLDEELAELQASYEDWDAATPETEGALVDFIDDYLYSEIPEDDNFHLVFLDGEFYESNPEVLPDILQPGSALVEEWSTLVEPIRAVLNVPDPQVGSILYESYPLEVNNIPRGVYVVAHLSAGERNEALAGISIFINVAAGVVVISFLMAWVGSHQLLKPVQALAQTARDINETNLSQRLEVTGSGELADLANTFNTMMDRVQTAFDTQRTFINDASHELRTPLTIIQGHLELMDNDPEEQRETLDLVMDELSRMGRFVNDLLLLVKAERPDFLYLETIELTSFVNDLFTKVGTLADRDWQLVNSGEGTFRADRQRITGALINLVQNAVQHTHSADTIELGAEFIENYVRFWIRDTGPGIPQNDQDRIFDRFARAANTYRRSEGAGLGLAIVKTIAEAHSGHVELTSQVGVGSTFSLMLPANEVQ